MKVSFIVTTHYSSELRNNGRLLIISYLKSLRENCKYPFTVYIIDNGSSELLGGDLIKDDTIYIFVKDQFKTGITGAWNRGIINAINDGSDIIINTNDDIIFNDSINNLIKIIDTHEHKDVSIYGPTTNVGGCPGPNNQERTIMGDRVLEVTQTSSSSWNGGHGINGFFNAFTKECYHNFQEEGNLYSTKKDVMIAGQESEMQIRLGKKGLRGFIIEQCMVYHEKIRGWQKIK